MPDKDTKDTRANVTHDDFVGKIVKDPKSPPDTILLTGYLGKSSEEGHTRLYFDPELKSYVEIPNEAILHSQQIPQEQSGLGGSNVWIARDAELIHGKVGPSRTKAKFFEGPIAAAAGAAAGGAGAVPLGITLANCPSQAPILCPPTPHAPCPSPIPHCPPSPPPLLCPHTVLPPCPTPLCTHVFTQCPTPLHGCPPPPTPQCTHVFTQCATPLHGCPPPPTPLCTHVPPCPTPLCTHVAPCPTPPVLCPPSVHQICPTPTVAQPQCFPTEVPIQCHPTAPQPCPIQSALNCPSALGCPSGPACVVNPGGGVVDPAAHAQALGIHPTSPVVCQVFTPACPSVHNICPTNPVICHPTLPHICFTNPVICRPSIFIHCPSPFCPSPACPSIHVGCPQSPFCPVTGGCPFTPVGGGGPQF
jgi:hypothetical protein